MITGQIIPNGRHTLLELNFPQGKQYVNVAGGIGEAERLVYYHNRKYIVEKLRSWLSQRKIAIKQSPDRSKVMTVAQLQVIINYYHHNSLYKVCNMVQQHRSLIESVAPAEGSQHFKYYQNTIVPILNFCEIKQEDER